MITDLIINKDAEKGRHGLKDVLAVATEENNETSNKIAKVSSELQTENLNSLCAKMVAPYAKVLEHDFNRICHIYYLIYF
jgi:adenylylsulfate kinase-like enzyme